MCQANTERVSGWQGWIDIPAQTDGTGVGVWMDLSHALGTATPVPTVPRGPAQNLMKPFPTPRFERIRSMPADPVNLTEIQMVAHFGTHIDAPVHFIADGPAIHEIPLERLHGNGVVIGLECAPLQPIDAGRLEEAGSGVRPGDIVLLKTGWAEYAGTPRYDEHPYLTPDAAEWLVGRRVKLVALDVSSPDLPIRLRQPGFTWPVHHILLSHGVLIAENVNVRRDFAPGRAEFMFCALNIVGSDGSPARVLGRACTD